MLGLEPLTEVLGQDPVHHLADLLVVDARQALDRPKRAVDADRWRQLVRQVKVRGAVVHRVGEQLVDVQAAVGVQSRLERLDVGQSARPGGKRGGSPDADCVIGLPVIRVIGVLGRAIQRHVVWRLGPGHNGLVYLHGYVHHGARCRYDFRRRDRHRGRHRRGHHLLKGRHRWRFHRCASRGRSHLFGRVQPRVDGVHEMLDGDRVGEHASGDLYAQERRDLPLLGRIDRLRARQHQTVVFEFVANRRQLASK